MKQRLHRLHLWLLYHLGETLVDIQVAMFALNARLTDACTAADTVIHNQVVALRRRVSYLRSLG